MPKELLVISDIVTSQLVCSLLKVGMMQLIKMEADSKTISRFSNIGYCSKEVVDHWSRVHGSVF